MRAEVKVPSLLQKLVGGNRSILAEGKTIEELLDHLEAKYPGLKARLIDEKGQINQFVNLYLNDEDIRLLGGLETKVRNGDVLTILPAMAGGFL